MQKNDLFFVKLFIDIMVKMMGFTGTLQLMQDKDDIPFRVGRPTTKHNEQLMNMTVCTQSLPG
jgi:hypothetical protein